MTETTADDSRPTGPASASLGWALTAVLGLALLACALFAGCGNEDETRAMDAYVAFVEPRLDGEAVVWGKIRSWNQRRSDGGANVDEPKYYTFLEREAVPFYEQLVKDFAGYTLPLERLRAAHREVTEFAQFRLEFVRTEQRLGDTFREGGQLLRDLSDAEEEAQQDRNDYDRGAQGTAGSFDGRYTRISLLWDDFHAVYLIRALEGDLTIEELRQRIRDHVLVQLEKMRHSRYADDEHAQQLRRVVVSTIDYFKALDAALDVYVPVKQAALYSDEQIKAGQKAIVNFQTELRDARNQ